MWNLYLKSYGCLIAFIAVLGIVIVAIISRLPEPSECDEYRLMNLESGNMPYLNSASLLQAGTIPRLTRIARLAANRSKSSYYFTLAFSPDNSMLAISGIGYAREMVIGTFLWKFRHSKLCVLEVGDISDVDPYDNFCLKHLARTASLYCWIHVGILVVQVQVVIPSGIHKITIC